MESAPLCPNSNNRAICNGVCMSIVNTSPSFCLPFVRKNIFQMFQSPHTHIHMIINVVLPTPLLHLILIVLDGLLSQKIISTSFFSNKSCMVPYFLMFLVQLPSGKAIVQLLLNPRLRLYQNGISISRFQQLRFKVKCSMGWTTNFMSVLLMIPNNFCNIQILVQVLHIKLGHVTLFFFWGCLKTPW